MTLKNKDLFKEILRFLVTGVVATVFDFGVCFLVSAALPDSIGLWKEVIYTTCGFAVGLAINYFMSVLWVYQNVDESVNKKSAKNITLFILFSVAGLLIGIGIMALFQLLDSNVIHSDFNNWLKFITDKEHYKFRVDSFFFALLFFGVKTLIVMVFNYLTRKIFIFKEKKPQEVA